MYSTAILQDRNTQANNLRFLHFNDSYNNNLGVKLIINFLWKD